MRRSSDIGAGGKFLTIVGGFAVLIPFGVIAGILRGKAIPAWMYVVGLIVTAVYVILGFYVYQEGKGAANLRTRVTIFSIIVVAVILVLGPALAPLIKFDTKSGHRSSYSSYDSSYRYDRGTGSYGGNRNSGGYGSATSSRSTAKPMVTSRPSYSNTSRKPAKPERTVDPMDHDIELYYLDYQDEFEDEDDAWDDFEDDPDVWDDY